MPDHPVTAGGRKPLFPEVPHHIGLVILFDGLTRFLFGGGGRERLQLPGDRRYLDFELKQRDLVNWNPGIEIGRRLPLVGHTYAYFAASLAQLELYREMPDQRLLVPAAQAIRFLTASNGMVITGGVGQAEVWTDDQDGGRDLQETCSACY
jgi:hypothetical protein